MEAVPSLGVSSMVVTRDGQFALLEFKGAGGPLTVAFPTHELPGLAVLALQVSEKAAGKRGEPSLQAFDVARAVTARAHDGHVLLTLVTPAGARLTFRLHPTGAAQLGASLERESDGVDLPPGALRN